MMRSMKIKKMKMLIMISLMVKITGTYLATGTSVLKKVPRSELC